MNVLDAIAARHAVKHYDPEFVIPEADVAKLTDAARRAPTAFNLQNHRLVLVRDPELRKQIRAVSWDQAQVTDASLLYILCADLKAWEKQPARYWRHAPEDIRDFMTGAIDQYYRGKEQVQRDEAMRSCGLAAMNLMLAAQDLGYESCPMDGFDFDAVGKLIQLPEDHVISLFVVIGKGTQPARGPSGPIDESEQLIHNRF